MLFICYKFNQKIAVFFIQEGRTALFCATENFSQREDDEVKHVLRYLVKKKGVDINSVDKVAFLRYFAFLHFCLAILFLGGMDTLIVSML